MILIFCQLTMWQVWVKVKKKIFLFWLENYLISRHDKTVTPDSDQLQCWYWPLMVQVLRPMLGQYQWSVSSVAPWSNIRCQELTILSGVWRQDCKVTFSGQTNYLIRIRDDQRCAGGGKVSAGVCKPANILSSTLTLSLIYEASQFILCQRRDIRECFHHQPSSEREIF